MNTLQYELEELGSGVGDGSRVGFGWESRLGLGLK